MVAMETAGFPECCSVGSGEAVGAEAYSAPGRQARPFQTSDLPGVGVWLTVYPASSQLSTLIWGPHPEGSASPGASRAPKYKGFLV